MLKRGVYVALMLAITWPAGAAYASSCADERGVDAKTLVDECLQVSPATHPPCNASNECSLIESEIRRGCGMLAGSDAPPFCKDYPN